MRNAPNIARRRVIALALTAGCLAASASAANLLTDGGFENGATDGCEMANPNGHPLAMRAVAEPGAAHSGQYACVIEASGDPYCGKAVSGAQVFRAAASLEGLAPGTLLRVQAWIKTEDLTFLSDVGNEEYRFVDAVVKPIVVAVDAGGRKIPVHSFEGQGVYGFGDNGSFKGSTPYTPLDILYQPPPDAAKAELQLETYSPIKTGRIYVDDVRIVPVALPETPADIPRCEVKRDAAGAPRLYVDGRLEAPLFTFGNSFSPVYYEEAAMAGAVGVHLHQIVVNLPWLGTASTIIEQVLQADPDAMIFPRVHCNVPDAAAARYRDEWVMDESGEPWKACRRSLQIASSTS